MVKTVLHASVGVPKDRVLLVLQLLPLRHLFQQLMVKGLKGFTSFWRTRVLLLTVKVRIWYICWNVVHVNANMLERQYNC